LRTRCEASRAYRPSDRPGRRACSFGLCALLVVEGEVEPPALLWGHGLGELGDLLRYIRG
jgi:hypothetical protein